jgi:HEAT repeat protein
MGIFGPNIKKMEQKKDVKGLLEALQHRKYQIRESSAFALDRIGWKAGNDTEKVHYLMAKKAWDDLTEMGGPAVNPLIQALEYAMKDYERRRAFIMERQPGNISALKKVSHIEIDELHEVFVRIGKPAIDPLIQAMKEKFVNERTNPFFEVCKILENIGEPTVEPLIQLLKDEDWTVQAPAAKVLKRIGDERAIEPLVQVFQDETQNVYSRQAAVDALGALNDERVIEPLVRALKDQNWGIRKSSVRVLKKLSWNPANTTERVYYLFANMSLGKEGTLKKDWNEIIGYGRHAVEPLIQSLHIKDTIRVLRDTRSGMRRIKLTLVGSPAKTFYLERPVGNVAFDGLIQIGKPAVEPLIQALKDNNRLIRWAAAQALGEIRDARAKESLTHALEDEYEEVRKTAKKALRKIR